MEYSVIQFLQLLGSISLFIYGMKVMSEGLQKVSASGLRKLFSLVASNRVMGVLSGFAVTGLIQSSSAATVLVVSFVNAGLVSLSEAIPLIMGANIGTTVTGLLVSTLGFNVDVLKWVLPLVGLTLPLMFSGLRRWSAFGEVFVGFSLLFVGLYLMKSFVPDLSSNPDFLEYVGRIESAGIWSILIFVLVGFLLTIVVQSSSVAMSVTLILVANQNLSIEAAAAMVIGENIGTTLTAFLASLVGNVKAKRTALAHILFNVIGAIWVVLTLDWFLVGVEFVLKIFSPEGFANPTAVPLGLALFHFLFNLTNTVLLLVSLKWFIKTIEELLPKRKSEKGSSPILSRNLVETPEIAVLEAHNGLHKLGVSSRENFRLMGKLLVEQEVESEQLLYEIRQAKERLDLSQFQLGEFLREVAQTNTTQETSGHLVDMFHMLNDFERINRLSNQGALIIRNKDEAEIRFKGSLRVGLAELFDLVDEAFLIMNENLRPHAQVSMEEADILEDRINDLRDTLRIKHLERIGKGKDMIESGLFYRDIYSVLEKIADHIYNIDMAVAELHGVKRNFSLDDQL